METRKITNLYGISSALAEALAASQSRPLIEGEYHVTEIISPPLAKVLTHRHEAEIVEDVSERLFALDGIVMHEVLSKVPAKAGRFVERPVQIPLGDTAERLVGTIDVVDGDTLTDYKRTAVWSVVYALKDHPEFGGAKPEHVAQVNIYAYMYNRAVRSANMATETQIPLIQNLQVQYIFRDWKKNEMMRSGTYPRRDTLLVPVEMWAEEKTLAYIEERVALHRAARHLPDDEIPICSPEERWTTPDVFALMKRGRKSAVKLYGTLTEALEAEITAGVSNHYIERRPGEDRRCLNYCPAAPFCRHGQLVLMNEEQPSEQEG